MDAEVAALLVHEARTHLSRVEGQLQRAAIAPSVVARSLHAVKGAASVLGLEEAVAVAHALEEEAEPGALAAGIARLAEAFVEVGHVDGGPRSLRRAIDALAGPVRGWGRVLGKDVGLQVEGDAQVAPEVLAPVLEAVIQLLRNAVEHGIERPALRAGKGPEGCVRVTLEQGLEARVTVEDDGGGIDLEAARRVLGQAQASDAAVLRGLVAPSVSTAGRVSAGAGRGLGLDVARSAVASLGGQLELKPTPGGLRVVLVVPAGVARSPV